MATYTAVAEGTSTLAAFVFPLTLIETITGDGSSRVVSTTVGGLTYAVTYAGSDLTAASPTPTGGTYTSLQVSYDGNVLCTITGFAAANFSEIINANAYDILDGDDTLVGTTGPDTMWGGDSGNEIFNGNGGGDTFQVRTLVGIAPTHQFNGAIGVDDKVSIDTYGVAGSTLDLRSSTFVSIEIVSIMAGGRAILSSSQFVGGELSLSTLFERFNGVLDTVAEIRKDTPGTLNLSTLVFNGVRPDVYGTASNETIVGTGVGDTLRGLGGNDVLSGLAGTDVIVGGAARDVMTGGLGADDFDFNAVGETGKTAATRDRILDFKHGLDDIDLRTIDANGAAAGIAAFKFQTAKGAAFTGVKGQLHWSWQNSPNNALDKTIVEGDINGNRVADFQIELKGLIALTAADFFL